MLAYPVRHAPPPPTPRPLLRQVLKFDEMEEEALSHVDEQWVDTSDHTRMHENRNRESGVSVNG